MGILITEGSTTERAKAQGRVYEQKANAAPTDNRYERQEADYYVYVWSVAKRNLKTEHALLGMVEVIACKPDQRYTRVGVPIPEPFPQRVEDVFGTGADPFVYHRGNMGARRIAQDICDPSNPTLNQKIENYGLIDPFFAVQNGTDFAKHGVFWSLNDPPLEEELQKAEEKRDKFLRYSIQKMDQIQAESPKDASRLMGAAGFDDRDVRIALDYFGEERPYHKKFSPMSACPNCATQLPQGVGFHFLPNGMCCVLDWKKTVDAGIKTKDDVPADKRWWKQPGRPRLEDTPEA